jgi:hypothetical protein
MVAWAHGAALRWVPIVFGMSAGDMAATRRHLHILWVLALISTGDITLLI